MVHVSGRKWKYVLHRRTEFWYKLSENESYGGGGTMLLMATKILVALTVFSETPGLQIVGPVPSPALGCR